jgi:outer membrane protein assembly factor BamA
MLYDSRDNSCRPTKGIYACLIPRFNFTWLGSSKNSMTLNAEFRTYLGLSQWNPAHLIAFWFSTGFMIYGKLPYLDLPAIGWDTYGRTGRGYVQGRIRGVDYVYGETEYRFPISRYTRILSGVVFFNATTCDNDDHSIKLFEYIAPAAGAGLRVMINKKSLSNLAIDMAFGLNGSRGLFLNINEAF